MTTFSDGKAFFDFATLTDTNGVQILGTQQSAITSLVAASGTADGTVADVTGSFDQGILNDNFKELVTNVDLILVALRTHGLIAT